MDQVVLAKAVAMAAHAGQTDKLGEPYFGHCNRVARRAMIETDDFDVIAAAYLHDTVEDTALTLNELVAMGFSNDTVKIVDLLTHRENEPYEEYVDRLARYAPTRIVKRCDIMDNTDPRRLAKLDQATQDRLLKKYGRAFAILEGYEPAEEEEGA